MTYMLLPCPFCGAELDGEDYDTVYPTGIVWQKRHNGLRSYHHRNEGVTADGQCWNVVCTCSAEVSGDSKHEAVQKWNTRLVT